jgi:hypothetical protein
MPDQDLNRRDAERIHDESNQFFRDVNQSTVQTGQLAMRTAVFINGGAAVSVLAFLGAIASKDKVTAAQLSEVASSLIWFAAGVAAAGLSLAFAFFNNFFTASAVGSKDRTWEHPYLRPGPRTKLYDRLVTTFVFLSVVAGAVSFILFMAGVFDVRNAIVMLAK